MTWDPCTRPNTVTLRVAKDTNPVDLKSSIVGHLRSGKTVAVDTIGVATNYIATKAAILARGELDIQGIRLNLIPSLWDYEIKESHDVPIKTGVRWIIEVDGR